MAKRERDGPDAPQRLPPAAACAVTDPPRDVTGEAHLDAVVAAVRGRRAVTDEAFDAIYPAAVRARSARFWTPVEVARLAAAMLVTAPSTRVLDVGSGAGKFCLVGALTSPGYFTGIEQRGHLVELAQAVARRHAVARAAYLHGDIRDVDWRAFDAIYLYNPFGENFYGDAEHYDASVELTPARYRRDVAYAVAELARARVGTRVVTYHGLGQDLPATYERCDIALAGSELIELWVQTRG